MMMVLAIMNIIKDFISQHNKRIVLNNIKFSKKIKKLSILAALINLNLFYMLLINTTLLMNHKILAALTQGAINFAK